MTSATAALLEEACAPYMAAGRFAWHFARGKLGGDPAFREMLARQLIPDGTVLDLGCGQGLLAAWLIAARRQFDAGAWPEDWPRPPRLDAYVGVELMRADVERARAAIGDPARFVGGDIRAIAFDRADTVVILDVLHYISRPEQNAVLTRVRDALAPSGVLLLRIGDADGGFGFRYGNWVDRAALFVRGHGLPTLHCRPASEWIATLHKLGFTVEALPMSAGTLFSNVLLVGRL